MSKQNTYKLAIQIAGMLDASLGQSCNLTKKQLKEVAKAAADANAQAETFTKAMQDAGPAIDGMWGGLTKAAGMAAKAVAAVTAAGTAFAAAATKVGSEFEAQMDSTAATANATVEEYEKMKQAAMEQGRVTSKTATESAQALEYMALAGWSVNDSIKALPGILRLSEASGLDLARTSDLTTDSMAALGLEVSDLSRYLDVSAKANNKSNQTAEQLMEAYIGVGGALRGLNVDLSESATALGVLANRGIKGSEGGNALNAVLINLTTGAGQAGKMMDKIGLSAFDATGKFKGLESTLQELNKKTATMTDEQKNATLAAIGGKQHVDALNALLAGLNTTVADGRSEWSALVDEMDNANGSLEQMAKTKMDNLKGDFAVLQSATEDAQIRFYDAINQPLREIVQEGTNLIYEYSGRIENAVIRTIPTIKRVLGDGIDAGKQFFGPMMAAGEWAIDHADILIGGITGIAGAITMLKAAQVATSGITSLMGALSGLGAAMSNPVFAAVAGTALLGSALVGFEAQQKVAMARMKNADLKNHFGSVSLSLEQLQKNAKAILGEQSLAKIGVAMEEIGKSADISKKLDDAREAMGRFSAKVSMGLEISGSDMKDYEEAISAMIEDSVKLAQQAKRSSESAISVIFGDGDAARKMLGGSDSLYSTLEGEMSRYGSQLGEVYRKAMEDNVIDVDEQKLIDGITKKMSDIQQIIMDAEAEAQYQVVAEKYSGQQMDAETFKNQQNELNDIYEKQMSDIDTASSQVYTSINARKKASDSGLIAPGSEGYMTEAMYQESLRQAESQSSLRRMEASMTNVNFSVDTILAAYSRDLEGIIPQIHDITAQALGVALSDIEAGDTLEDTMHWTSDQVKYFLNTEGLKEESRGAIEDCWSQIQETFKQLIVERDALVAKGEEIPKELQDGIKNAAVVGSLAGDTAALWELIQSGASGSEYQQAVKTAEDGGKSIPEELAKAINSDESKARVKSSIDDMYSFLGVQVSRFGNISIPAIGSSGGTGIQKHAAGGILTTPHIGMVAENGPEAVIPLDGTDHAIDLWKRAGEALGVSGGDSISTVNNNSTTGSQISYSPTYNISGSNTDEVRKAVDSDYEKFTSYMDRYYRDRARLAF